MPAAAPAVVYTDGACSGNPGPGGWAWAEPGGPWATGRELRTTNQRMEIAAAFAAAVAHPGSVEIVTDSTYVKNCFDNRWYVKWMSNGWRNSQRKLVANRDLWEPFIDLYLARPGEISFRWVKGHSGDQMNDLVDRLAVSACLTQESGAGSTPPEDPGPSDSTRRRRATASTAAPAASPSARDSRVPEGHRLAVFGHRPPELGGYGDNPTAGAVRRLLGEILAAKAELHADLVVLTGLRLGAETLAAEAALSVDVPYVVILPYPDPQRVWSADFQTRFQSLLAAARGVVTLERVEPATKADGRSALSRRDGWLMANADEALLVWDRRHASLVKLSTTLEKRFGDDLWVVEPDQ
ncbi:MAG: ribonuclease H [Acidimicrobiales bacterium]